MSKIGYIGNINAFVDIQTEEILEKLRAYKADIYGIETTSEVKDVDELLVTLQQEWYSGTPQNCLIMWAIFCLQNDGESC